VAHPSPRIVTLSPAATTHPTSGSFLVKADARETGQVLLVKLDLRAKGANPARTIRLSDREFTDADGNVWASAILDKSGLDASGALLETAWQPVDYQLVVGDLRLWFQGFGETFATLLSQYDFAGTPATVYQAFEDLTAPADWRVILPGAEVARVVGQGATEVSLHLVQTRKWMVDFPSRTIEKSTFPDAPQESIGLTIPVVIGDFVTGNDTLDTNEGTPSQAYLAGISRGHIPTIVIGSGLDEEPRYLVTDVAPGTDNDFVYLLDRQSGILGRNFLGVTSTNSSHADPYYYLQFNTGAAHQFDLAVLGIEKNAATTAPNWFNAARPHKDYDLKDAATLTHDSTEDILQIDLPELQSLGEFDRAFVRIFYAWNAAGGLAPRFGVKHTSGDVLTTLTAAAPAVFPAVTPNAAQSLEVTSSVADWANIPQGDLYVETRAAGQIVQVFRIALIVRYRPAARLVARGQPIFGVPEQPRLLSALRGSLPPLPRSSRELGRTPDVLAFDPALWTHQYGARDGLAGTYTGTVQKLIEHPADFVHYLLGQYGGLGTAEVETAASTHGSFVDIRTTLSDYKMQLYASSKSTLDEWIDRVGSQFLIWFFRKNTDVDSAWAAVPWQMGDAINYRSAGSPFYFSPDHVAGSLNVSYTTISRVRNTVRVNFDHDIRTRSYGHQVYITPTDSYGWTGSAYARDQNAGPPENRETVAAASETLYGAREHTLNLDMVKDAATATDIRDRFFDLTNRPLVIVRFKTFLNAVDLERGQVVGFSEDWDSILPCPVQGSGGSWYGKGFRVVRSTRSEGEATTYDIEAVEV